MEALTDHSNKLDHSMDQEYYVDIILDKRIQNNRIEYYVKWTGFDDSHNSWEPLFNLSYCKELVREFENKLTLVDKKKKKSIFHSTITKKRINKNINSKKVTCLPKQNSDKVDVANKLIASDPKVSSSINENVEIKTIHSDKFSEKSNKNITLHFDDPVTIKRKEVNEKTNILNDCEKYKEETMIQNEPEGIINVAPLNGQLMILLKWKNIEETDIILAKEFNLKWPQLIIKFYEDRLRWPDRPTL